MVHRPYWWKATMGLMPEDHDAVVPSLPSEIRTPRLLVRRWRLEDAAALHDAVVASTDHLRPWLPWIADEPLTVADRRQLIEGWVRKADAGGDTHYGVWEDGEVVAGAGLHRRVGPGGLEIGYWVHVDHAGRGIATEAAGALTDAAFGLHEIDHVEIHHDVANPGSGRVPEKLGYPRVVEVAVVDDVAAPAETGRRLIWRVGRDEWRARPRP